MLRSRAGKNLSCGVYHTGIPGREEEDARGAYLGTVIGVTGGRGGWLVTSLPVGRPLAREEGKEQLVPLSRDAS
jgi:hypothetical protein